MHYKTKTDVIPDWAEQSVKSATNSQVCEVCKQACTDIVSRKSRHTYAERRRTNRVRIKADYWDCENWNNALIQAGITKEKWAGKLVCSDCSKRFDQALCGTK